MVQPVEELSTPSARQRRGRRFGTGVLRRLELVWDEPLGRHWLAGSRATPAPPIKLTAAGGTSARCASTTWYRVGDRRAEHRRFRRGVVSLTRWWSRWDRKAQCTSRSPTSPATGGKRLRKRLAPDHEALELPERLARPVQLKDHAGHRWGALQVRNAMPRDQCRHRCIGCVPGPARTLQKFIEIGEVAQDRLVVDTKVDQAGDVINVYLLERPPWRRIASGVPKSPLVW